MTDSIDKLIAQVEEMIAEQEKRLKRSVARNLWSNAEKVENIISGMRQVLAVIRLYEE